jgi:8-oxo-dGTP diphosphatase
VEPGETDEAALARECREELDVVLDVGPRLWEGRHTYPDLTVELVLYQARLVAGEPKPLGAHALRFLSPAEMTVLPFCEADIPLLDDLVAGRMELPR